MNNLYHYVEEFTKYSRDCEHSLSEKIDFLLNMDAHHFTQDVHIKPQAYVRLISGLSETCPSTALSFAMHLYTQWGLQKIGVDEKLIHSVLKESASGRLFASLNEPGFYFLREDQLNPEQFSVHARKTEQGYVINGVKKFVSLEPYVHFLPVYCYVDNPSEQEGRIAVLLIRRSSEGISVKPDWDTISMSESNSNSLLFDNVSVPYIDALFTAKDALQKTNVFGYLFRLSIVSVYYGIAKRAYDFVKEYCRSKQVPHTNRALSFFPGVQFSVAEMSILLETSFSQITRYSNLLDDVLSGKLVSDNISNISLITKELVTRNAEQIVNIAMKISGISSIGKSNILSKLYQDVKAGGFHPPQSDVAYEMIAKYELGVLTHRTRWL
ncbi:Acyl-CoA dehydrogenase [Paenibacillus sp. OK060]|uniref:acyl-CoA dehydrogenase family protein n=1 Tax=Paenibacillus sp. OK060 TaxID=1881034 RepID=UPI0008812D89|nr:acyl-CoA dehydrogenase family protein [Paenibacillus sp. OK060]SDM33442.1 Acyl-CoA dehydrogenase [Paenibacillus sp. OK060]